MNILKLVGGVLEFYWLEIDKVDIAEFLHIIGCAWEHHPGSTHRVVGFELWNHKTL